MNIWRAYITPFWLKATGLSPCPAHPPFDPSFMLHSTLVCLQAVSTNPFPSSLIWWVGIGSIELWIPWTDHILSRQETFTYCLAEIWFWLKIALKSSGSDAFEWWGKQSFFQWWRGKYSRALNWKRTFHFHSPCLDGCQFHSYSILYWWLALVVVGWPLIQFTRIHLWFFSFQVIDAARHSRRTR